MATGTKKGSTGRKQYSNPIRAAIASTSGIAMAGSRASASKRIVGDSELRRASTPTQYRDGTANFRQRLGLDRKNRYLGADRRVTVQRHRADRKDPTTGFGINVNQVRRYKVGISGS